MIDLAPLKKLGMDEAEINAYVTLLKVGPCLSGTLAKETKINRTHNYDVLNRLSEKGFVSFFYENGKKFFKASPPEVIFDYTQNIGFEIQQIIPSLRSMKPLKKEESFVEVYKGLPGFRTVINDMLNNKENIFVLGEQGHFEEYAPILLKQFLRMLRERKLKEKVLVVEGSHYDGNERSEIRILPKRFKSNSYTVMYGDKVRISIWAEEPFFILIKNREVAELYKKQFEVFWNLSKVIEKNRHL